MKGKPMGKRTTDRQTTDDERIIDMYWERNPDAIQKTDHKYGSLLRNVAYNILSDYQDCEECQNDTYLKIWNTIPSTRPPTFFSYVIRIMREIAIDRFRKKSRKKRIPSQLTISLEELEALSTGVTVEDVYEAKELGKLISEYVRGLSDRQRYIFMDRYYFAEPVERIASDLSVSTQVVYKEIRKIKQGLKEYLEGNGVHV